LTIGKVFFIKRFSVFVQYPLLLIFPMKNPQASRPGFPPAVHSSMAQLRNPAGGPPRQLGAGSGSHSRQALSGGFTLIELLAVIAILAILAALVFPLFGSIRASSHAVNCTANLRTLHQATLNFSMDNDGFFPVAKTPTAGHLWVFKLAGSTPDSPGYLGLPGANHIQRNAALLSLNSRRAPFCLWCPATEVAHPRPSGLTTYALNVNVGGTGTGWPGNPPVPTLKMVQVTSPARTALFMDAGIRPNGNYGVWVGEAGFLPSPVHPPAIFKQANNPKRSVNVVFVDGHVEMRRIGDIPTDFRDPFWGQRD